MWLFWGSVHILLPSSQASTLLKESEGHLLYVKYDFSLHYTFPCPLVSLNISDRQAPACAFTKEQHEFTFIMGAKNSVISAELLSLQLCSTFPTSLVGGMFSPFFIFSLVCNVGFVGEVHNQGPYRAINF